MKLNRQRTLFQTHRLTILLISTALALFACILGYLYHSESETRKVTHADSIEQQRQSDVIIAEITKEREAKRLASEKAKKALAAKKAAEQAKHADESTPTKIASAACRTNSGHANPGSIDVVINKKNCITPLNFAPSDLVTSHGATISSQANNSFNALFSAAEKSGKSFSITSSYRSYSNQISTYNYWVGISGKDGADTYSARPGYSEHQTGLSIDVAAGGCALDCFGTSSQYAWMQKNAADYGFIQRYYKGYESITGYSAEEWHYRYVGKAVALDMKARDIKTLEQYWGLAGGKY